MADSESMIHTGKMTDTIQYFIDVANTIPFHLINNHFFTIQYFIDVANMIPFHLINNHFFTNSNCLMFDLQWFKKEIK